MHQGGEEDHPAPAPDRVSWRIPTASGGGRRHEMDTLRHLLPDLLGGRGGVAVVSGPAGIGKTFLAHSFLTELPKSVLSVTAASMGHRETPTLWPVRQIARSLLLRGPGELRDVWERLDRIPPQSLTGELAHIQRLVDFLLTASAAAPVVALLDDLEHVDPLTLAAVETLAERLHAHAFLLLVCSRTGGTTRQVVERTLDQLRGHPQVVTLPLGGLPDDVVERLVATTREGIAPADQHEIARLSSGNPLLAQELAYLWAAQQRIADLGGPAPAPPVSPTLRDLVAERLAAVDADDVLAPLALLGRPVTLTLLAEAGDMPTPVVRRAIERACVAGLVTMEGSLGQVRMAHSVFGEVLLQRLAPIQAREIHLRLAALFGRSSGLSGPHQVERAHHLIASGDNAEATATACLAAALYEERAGSPRAALDLVSYGLDSCTSDLTTRVKLLRTRGRCLFRCGRAAAAWSELLQAVEAARSAENPSLFATAVADLTAIDAPGDPAGADDRLRLLREAVSVGGSRPDAVQAVLSARLAELLHLSDPARSRRLTRDAVSAAGDDPRARLEAHHAWVLTTSGITRLDEIDRSRELFVSSGQGPRPDAPALFLTPALIRGDRTSVDHLLARADSQEALFGRRAGGLLAVARLAVAQSDADAPAVAALTRLVIDSPDADIRLLAVLLQHLWAFHTDPSGVPERASGRPNAAADLAAAPSAELADLLAVAWAALSARSGNHSAAAWLRSRLGDGPELPATAIAAVQDLAWAVTALAGQSLGNDLACRGALEHLGGHSDKFVTVSTALIGPVGWFAAGAHEVLGEYEASVNANAHALELSRLFASVTWTAQCLAQRAALLCSSAPEQSRDLAEEALALARSRGLAGIAGLAQKVLDSLGSPDFPLDSRQLDLLRLAASGLRNDQIARRLYVSTPTVERRLSQIYRKLGVSNRAAAAHWLSRQGPPHMPAGDAW